MGGPATGSTPVVRDPFQTSTNSLSRLRVIEYAKDTKTHWVNFAR